MANYSELLNDINAAIYENNDQEIDALEVRAILREMVASLGSGFLFKGIATPSSPSGTGTYEPDQNVFYLATTAGTYTYLGGLVVAAGEVAFLCFDGTWTKKSSALLSTGSIVDNTTTEDATKPLSAKQGKVLADAGAATAAEVTALGHKVDEFIDGVIHRESYLVPRGYDYTIRYGDLISLSQGITYTFTFTNSVSSAPLYISLRDGTTTSALVGGSLTIAAGDSTGVLTYTPASDIVVFIGYNHGDWDGINVSVVVASSSGGILKSMLKGWILSEAFTLSSATRDTDGNVTAANVVWPDTKTGTLTITRDTDGNATQMVATHDGSTYTLSITRNADGYVTATSIN